MSKILSCDGNGVCTVSGMPVIDQGDARLKESPYGTGQDGADCYDASVCSVVVAALANRDVQRLPQPANRTRYFDQIPATTGVPKELNQLAWQGKTAGTSKAFYFPEVLADFGPLYQRSPDPYVYSGGATVLYTGDHGAAFRDWTSAETRHLTDAYVKALLDDDFVTMLGFRWATPSVDASGKVRFALEGGHKLVVSGYRDGTYGLRVNDIFDGKQQWTRLVPIDRATRSFGTVGTSHQAITEAVLADLPTRVYLEFEGHTAPTDSVCFVTQIDALSLNWRPPRRVLNWHWSAGWTHFVPFVVGGQPHMLIYNTSTGEVHFDRLVGDGSRTVWSGRWAAGWTQFVPFTANGSPHLIAYNGASGEVHIDRIRTDMRGDDGVWAGRWEAGFTHFMPFVLDGTPHFLAYNARTGRVHFDRLYPGLNGSFTRFAATWSAGWTHFMPFVLDEQPHFLAYNATTGTVHFDRVGRQGGLGGAEPGNDLFLDIRWEGAWAAGWTHFVPVIGDGMPHFFAYNAATGEMHCDRVNGGAQGSSGIWAGTTTTGFTSAASFALDERPHVLLFNRDSGEIGYWAVTTL